MFGQSRLFNSANGAAVQRVAPFVCGSGMLGPEQEPLPGRKMNPVDQLVEGGPVEAGTGHPIEHFTETYQQIDKAKENVIVQFDE